MKTTDFNAKLAAITPANPAMVITLHPTIDNYLGTAMDVPEERVKELNDQLNALYEKVGVTKGSQGIQMQLASYLAKNQAELAYMAYSIGISTGIKHKPSTISPELSDMESIFPGWSDSATDVDNKVKAARAKGQSITSDEFIESFKMSDEATEALKAIRDKMFGKGGSK